MSCSTAPAPDAFSPDALLAPLTATPLRPTRMGLLGLPRRIVLRLAQAMACQRQRRRLGQLDPRLYRDIGISPAAAEAESRRPIWDAPGHWRL